MTHEHELSGGGDCWREWGVPSRGRQREKNWDNCHSIIKKIYLNFLNVQINKVIRKMEKINKNNQ